jgi:hypothetical protein
LILLKAFFVARVFACSREVSLESFLCLEWSVADGKGEQMEKVSADGKGVSRWKRCQQMEKVSGLVLNLAQKRVLTPFCLSCRKETP